MAIYLVTSHKKGISSCQLARDIKVTQKTAWFMLHRIRHVLQYGFEEPLGDVSGIIEIDESFVGGKNKNRHFNKRVPYTQGRAFKDKKPVFGILERNGKVKAFVIDNTSTKQNEHWVHKLVYQGCEVFTDEWWRHSELNYNFDHMYVNHSKYQYVMGHIHTNTIEGFWSHLKRSIFGVYHMVTPKHLQKYVNEIVFRYNTKKMSECERIKEVMLHLEGRLKYKNLIGKT